MPGWAWGALAVLFMICLAESLLGWWSVAVIAE